jgi:hypothetical protein
MTGRRLFLLLPEHHDKNKTRTIAQVIFFQNWLSERMLPIRLESAVPQLRLEYPMAPRANWKGFLRLSLVTCPVALYPATSDSEKISFNQINKKTGHRIKYLKVDADTGEEVASDEIIKQGRHRHLHRSVQGRA